MDMRWKPSRRSQSCRWYGEPDRRCLVDRRPYNDQNKDQADQKVGQRKRGKKKKDRVERTKDCQQRNKTELNCQCVIELRVFLCLLCILSLKIELCMDTEIVL